jgi:hypothetical protein
MRFHSSFLTLAWEGPLDQNLALPTQRNDDVFRGGRTQYLASVHSLTCVRERAPISHGAPLPHALKRQNPASLFVILASITAGRFSFAVSSYMRLISENPSAPKRQRANSLKSDISVDSVHTPFGRTNRAHTAPFTSKGSLLEEFALNSTTSCCTRNPEP